MFEKTKTFLAKHALHAAMGTAAACVGLYAGTAISNAEIKDGRLIMGGKSFEIKDGRLIMDGTSFEIKDDRLFVNGVRWSPAKRCDCPAPTSQP